jgi:acid stress chaperone HdeB
MKIRLLMAAALLAPLLVALPPATGQAQVTVDVAKITCKQFLLDAVAPTKSVAMWLSGYYHGKHSGTVVDFGALQREADKVEDYCRLNLDMTVMDAVEHALAVSK